MIFNCLFWYMVVFQVANASNLSVLVAANINRFLDWILTNHNRPHSPCPIKHWKTFPAKASRSSSLFEWSASIYLWFSPFGIFKRNSFSFFSNKAIQKWLSFVSFVQNLKGIIFGNWRRVEKIKKLSDGPNSNWHWTIRPWPIQKSGGELVVRGADFAPRWAPYT